MTYHSPHTEHNFAGQSHINPDAQEIHLSDYLNIILYHKWLVFFFLFLTMSVVTAATYTTIPVYEASSKLIIGLNKNISPISGQVPAIESYYAEEKSFNTHFKLITSKPVMKQVARDIDFKAYLDQTYMDSLHPMVRYASGIKKNIRPLKKRLTEQIKSLLPFTPEQDQTMVGDVQDQKYLELLSKITVKQIEETQIMEILVNDIHPERARVIANAVAEEYIKFDQSTKLKLIKDKLAWMTNELFVVKKKLETSEKKFLDYKQNQKMFSMEGKQIVINQKIAAFNQNYLDARNTRLELDIMLNDLETALGNDNNIMQIKPMVNAPIIKDLYATLTTLEIKKGHLSKVYKSKHPKLIQVNSEISDTRAKLKVELKKKLASLKRKRIIQSNKEKEMKNQISDFENEAMQTNEKELTYNILKRNVDTNQQIYEVLLSQIKESNILLSGYISSLTIVEKADTPVTPVKPNKKRNFLLSIILGLFGGIGLAFFLEYLDQTIRHDEDAEIFLGYPVLSIVPDAQIPSTSQEGG